MKIKLDIDEMEDEFFRDTRLLGIMAPLKDYQLCWLLNQWFRFKFRMNNDIEIQLNKKQRQYYFPVYQYSEPHTCMVHYIYNNQHDGEYLLPEFKHLDYLWLLKGDVVEGDAVNDMIESIKCISSVQLIVELTNEKILNKGHLIF
jgi:hypothetical protein